MRPTRHSADSPRPVRAGALRVSVALIWLLCWQSVAAGLPATSAQGDAALLQQVQQVLCSLAFAPAGDAESGLTHCPLCAQAAALALPATATGPIQPVIRACWPAGEPALGGSRQRARPQSARGPPFRA